MKRGLFAIFTTIILIISQLINISSVKATENTALAEWPTGPSVFAEGAIVMEASTGLILYEKNIDQAYYPASITKIMTALLTIENSNPGDIVTLSRDAYYNVELDSSRVGIEIGEQLTVQQALYAVLLMSANEVSYALAEHVAGTMSAFVEMMNKRAKEIGCKNTNFANPHGLPDNNHYTTPYDMALITREAMKNETFRKIFAARTYQIPPTNITKEARPLRNHHKFILKQDYIYDGCIGGKTGYTSKAKYTLVTVAKRGNLELICVVMRDDTSDHQYTDTKKLLDFGYNNFSIYPIADLEKPSQIISESPFFTKYNALLSQNDKPIYTDKNGYLVLPNNASFEDAQKEIIFYTDKESGATTANKVDDIVIGQISYTYNGKYVGGANIIYRQDYSPGLERQLPNMSSDAPVSDQETLSAEPAINLRPVIIGAIIGILALLLGFYFVLIERPRLRRKKVYYRSRRHRRKHDNDDFFDFL
jgi:D-alanyl-D-alanine carboxypeptidase